MNENRTSFLKKIFYESLPQMVAYIGAILFFLIIYRFGVILEGFYKLCHILMPVIIGVSIAYIVHPVVNLFEGLLNSVWKKVAKKDLKKEKGMRIPAIIISFLLIACVLYLLAYMILPQLYLNVSRIVNDLPEQITFYYNKLLEIISDDVQLSIWVNNIYKSMMDFITGWVKKDLLDQITMLMGRLMGVVGAVSNFILGIIVAIYLLISKETFKRQFNMILDAFFHDKVAKKLREILKKSDSIFGGFISGKIIDSLIIGAICFAGALILGFPYPALISVIVGVTNIIPFFGPYIGAIPSALIIFLESPTKGVIFIIFVVILQQFDGNILGPKILGGSTGLSPFWVIFAIILGSGLFGFIGMIIGVPTFGVVYYLCKNFLEYQLEKRGKLQRKTEKEKISQGETEKQK